MEKSRFDEFVEDQLKTKTEDIDWASKKAQWQANVKGFYREVESFLKSYTKSGKIQIKYDETTLREDYIGEYKVERAIILLGAHSISLQPIGTNLFGARGRIDMIGPRGKVTFVLVDKESDKPKLSVSVSTKVHGKAVQEKEKTPKEWAWKIATPPPISLSPLSDESFFEALMKVTDG